MVDMEKYYALEREFMFGEIPKTVEFFTDIVLTEDEVRAAIIEGKKKKYFSEKHKADWPEEKEEIDHEGYPVKYGLQS